MLVLSRFKQLGPMTVAECAERLGKPVKFIAPRVTELVACGAVEPALDLAARRPASGRGRSALVYRAAESSVNQ